MKLYFVGILFALLTQICPLIITSDESSPPPPAPTAEVMEATVPAMRDYSALKDMARSAACSDRRNELYEVDGAYVIWFVAGDCADAAYSTTLFDADTQEALCSAYDSIAGPQVSCIDAQYDAMFNELLNWSPRATTSYTLTPIPLE